MRAYGTCPQLPTIAVFFATKIPSTKGLTITWPQMFTMADDCAGVTESGLKPPFESPHLDFLLQNEILYLQFEINCVRFFCVAELHCENLFCAPIGAEESLSISLFMPAILLITDLSVTRGKI